MFWSLHQAFFNENENIQIKDSMIKRLFIEIVYYILWTKTKIRYIWLLDTLFILSANIVRKPHRILSFNKNSKIFQKDFYN